MICSRPLATTRGTRVSHAAQLCARRSVSRQQQSLRGLRTSGNGSRRHEESEIELGILDLTVSANIMACVARMLKAT